MTNCNRGGRRRLSSTETNERYMQENFRGQADGSDAIALPNVDMQVHVHASLFSGGRGGDLHNILLIQLGRNLLHGGCT